MRRLPSGTDRMIGLGPLGILHKDPGCISHEAQIICI
jgi:hypothetical protein